MAYAVMSAPRTSNMPPGPALSPRAPWSSRQPNIPIEPLEPIMVYNNAVYYPNWRLAEPGKTPACLSANVISHIFYAFANVSQADGSVKLSHPYYDDEMPVDGCRGGLRATLALRQRNEGLKVILSIGGSDASVVRAFQATAASQSKRRRFAETARALVDHYGLDGIDIHWEHLYDMSDCNHYLLLLAEVRRQLPAGRYVVTSALGANEWSLTHLDLSSAQHFLDGINLVAYDFSGPWSAVAGHCSQCYAPAVVTDDNAQCTTVLSALRHYIRKGGVPARKISVGVPCFGRSFLGASHVGDAFSGPGGGGDGIFPYCALPRPEAKAGFDDEAKAAYCIGGDGGFVSYDNPDSVKIKADLVKELGLAGLFFWDAPSDYTSEDDYRSIVMAGYLYLSPGQP